MSSYCIWCHEEMVPSFTWKNIFHKEKPKQMCEQCEMQLDLLYGERCHQCSRQSEHRVCADCNWWKKYFSDEDPLQFNKSVYHYNFFMQEIISKWKYRGDYVLANMFREQFIKGYVNIFSFLNDPIAVPIPLSDERMQKRRFNQAEQLASFLPIPTEQILSRHDTEKQSKKSRNERIRMTNPFTLTTDLNNPIILVDDIYTTGATLRQAAALLRQHGNTEIYAYTLIRG